MGSPLDDYQLHCWELRQVELASPAYQDLLGKIGPSELNNCGYESAIAARHYGDHHSSQGLFFYDAEQLLSMELDAVYGVAKFGVLTEGWENFAPGALVLVLYRGVTEIPPTLTVAISS
jgi:hypothetical protein